MSFNLLNIGAVILAAGKGTRLNHPTLPKVMAAIGGRPILDYVISTLEQVGFTRRQICAVVGYRQEIIKRFFKQRVSYASQEELLGTAHAAYIGIRALPEKINHVLVMGGDDSAFYSEGTIQNLISQHINEESVLTLLVTKVQSPGQLGRVVRQSSGRVEIVEKEYLTSEQKLINEISTGTFVFNRKWYEKIFPVMPKLTKIREYGLPAALMMAQNGSWPFKIASLLDPAEWFGVNTQEELAEADLRKQASYQLNFKI